MISNLSIIVAITKDFAIGNNNDLLTHIPGDLKRFKEITSGHSIIMGRNTLLSLPKWPLPKRRNIVMTTQKDAAFEGCEVVHSVDEAVASVKGETEAFVIGGGKVYEQMLPQCSKLYLTIVDKSFEADTYFPTLNWDEWEEVEREDIPAGDKADFAYAYVTLVRKG